MCDGSLENTKKFRTCESLSLKPCQVVERLFPGRKLFVTLHCKPFFLLMFVV